MRSLVASRKDKSTQTSRKLKITQRPAFICLKPVSVKNMLRAFASTIMTKMRFPRRSGRLLTCFNLFALILLPRFSARLTNKENAILVTTLRKLWLSKKRKQRKS